MKIYILLILAVIATVKSESSIGSQNSQPTNEYLPSLETSEGSGDSTSVGADGYEYRTIKRFKYRHRRDVSELPNQEYLPPNVEGPNEESAPVGQDGYEYRTVKRLKYRNKRDVSELPNQEYLPPNGGTPSNEYLAPSIGESQGSPAPLGQDGYQYRTVKRLKYRNKRDVSELPSQEYLPPNGAPSNEYLAPSVGETQGSPAPLGQDGYQYRTVKRLKYRNKRDVSELPNQEYLPPNGAPSNEYLAPSVGEPQGVPTPVGQDGYQYRTVKRFRYRNKRDVSELPNQEYLPPNGAPSNEYLPPVDGSSDGSTPVGKNGYEYKTAKRLRYRLRRH